MRGCFSTKAQAKHFHRLEQSIINRSCGRKGPRMVADVGTDHESNI